jgi:hypothetical protein
MLTWSWRVTFCTPGDPVTMTVFGEDLKAVLADIVSRGDNFENPTWLTVDHIEVIRRGKEVIT